MLADLILGHQPVAAVEWDAYACQVLRERAADGWFPGLHVHEGDVRLFDPSGYAGRVDCIHAGFPCQDVSAAGRRAGVGEGTRSGLYREVLRIADVVRPRYIFLENVAAILGNGLGTVLGDLASRGYDSRWACIRAADVGAPHLRDRWWCLASNVADAARFQQGRQEQRAQWQRAGAGRESVALAHAHQHARHEGGPRNAAQEPGGRHADRGGERSDDPAAIGNSAQGQQPGRADPQGRQGPDVRPTRPLRDGDGWWQLEPDVGRVADGVAARVDRLKALGNGQVPLQAALGWIACGGPVTPELP